MSHFADGFTVLIDACCVAGALRRNMLLSLAEVGFYSPFEIFELAAYPSSLKTI